jgi:hypothetical protein
MPSSIAHYSIVALPISFRNITASNSHRITWHFLNYTTLYHLLIIAHLVMSTSLSSIPNQLHSTNHLTNSEKSQQLSSQNTTRDKLCLIEVSHSRHDTFWVRGGILGCALCLLCEGSWVSDGFDGALEVGLESAYASVGGSVVSDVCDGLYGDRMGKARLTAATSFVPERQAFRAQDRLESSR